MCGETSESDVRIRRQNLTSKYDPRANRIKTCTVRRYIA